MAKDSVIKKKELLEYVETVFDTKVGDAFRKVYDTAYKVAEPIVAESVADIAELFDAAASLKEALDNVYQNHPTLKDDWSHVGYIGKYLSAFSNYRKAMAESIARAVQVQENYRNIPAQLFIKVKADHDVDAAVKRFEDTKKLKDECLTIIKSSKNGEEAFNTLTSLGLDLSAFVPSARALPAVVKLSVDPSIVNPLAVASKSAEEGEPSHANNGEA